ncbi:MAG: hypothetical protein ACTSWM_10120 [Alphaproteobacteria bacterium]
MSEATPEPAVLPREPDALPADLPRGGEIPADLDPLAEGILMAHQVAWLEDTSDLKLAEKGRRTGITFAEALDDTLIAAASRSAGGDNVFYIGDTKDKGREFIGYVAHFASVVAKQAGRIEEFLFEDRRADGTTRNISAFRIQFDSGYRVEALSSRPENIRGLQGVVVIDEAAFHMDVRSVIDAVNALLIWGGKIRVISTHNRVLNPFNELVREARAGKSPFKVHFIPFETAIENGLYERVCYVRGWQESAKGKAEWLARIRGSYGARTAAMRQELDCIPAEGEGAALTRVQIEACMQGDIPVVRWSLSDDFKNSPAHIREADARDFCEREIKHHLATLVQNLQTYMGEDVARSGDMTSIWILQVSRTLQRLTRIVVEMRNVPYSQQEQVLFYICDRLPRFCGGAMDATGNGEYLAEQAALRYGEAIAEVKLSVEWYRTNMPRYVAGIIDRDLTMPADADILADHQGIAYVNGIPRVPDNHRSKGADGLDRHGDSAIAGALCWHAAATMVSEYGVHTLGELDEDRDPEWRDRQPASHMDPRRTNGGLY